MPFGHSSLSKNRVSGSHSHQKHSASLAHKQSASAHRHSAKSNKLGGVRNTIAGQRGTLRSSAVPGNQSMVSMRRPKFDLDRLLKANSMCSFCGLTG